MELKINTVQSEIPTKQCSSFWTNQEDKLLMHLVDIFGENRWARISPKIESKSGLNIFYRYQYLRNELVKDKYWNNEEDSYLLFNHPKAYTATLWKKFQLEFKKEFKKYIPIFVLRFRFSMLSKAYNSSMDINHNVYLSTNPKYLKRKRLNNNLNGLSSSKLKVDDKNYYKMNLTNTEDLTNCLNEINFRVETFPLIEDEKCLIKELLDNQRLLKAEEKLKISKFTNKIDFSKVKKDKPFKISKVPKHIRYPYILKNNMKELDLNNKQLGIINRLLVNEVKKLNTIQNKSSELKNYNNLEASSSHNQKSSSTMEESISNNKINSAFFTDKSFNFDYESNYSVLLSSSITDNDFSKDGFIKTCLSENLMPQFWFLKSSESLFNFQMFISPDSFIKAKLSDVKV